MYTIREHRKEMATTGLAVVAMVVFFLACLFGPWVLRSVSPWLAIVAAGAAAWAWSRWGLWSTGGPPAVVSRTLVYVSAALLVIVAGMDALGLR